MCTGGGGCVEGIPKYYHKIWHPPPPEKRRKIFSTRTPPPPLKGDEMFRTQSHSPQKHKTIVIYKKILHPLSVLKYLIVLFI